MIDPQKIREALAHTSMQCCADGWIADSVTILEGCNHGDRGRWMQAVAALPDLVSADVCLDRSAITVTGESGISELIRDGLSAKLMQLHPWRKGPFNLFGVSIDSEWRSDWKWQRIQQKISSLSNRKILDVGCGNGYYLFRMLGEGAKLAVGIDPTQLFLAQFTAINHYVDAANAFILPMKSDEFSIQGLPPEDRFDTVFSMGVYYHRKQPLAHLQELLQFLKPGGELVIETLVIDSDEDTGLQPANRYAQMRNVWSLPSVARLSRQLNECGFADPQLIDLSVTTVDEQRATQWMTFDSLSDYLDPCDRTLTIEGYPAPVRACMIATRPTNPIS